MPELDPTDALLSSLHFAFVGFIALFPLVNPLGSAIVVAPLLRDLGPRERRWASAKIASYGFVLSVSTLALGSFIFRVFGISQSVVQLAGGILICQTAWNLLGEKPRDEEDREAEAEVDARSRVAPVLFYPLTFPMTFGAGTISVLLALSSRAHSRGGWLLRIASDVGVVIAIASICLLVFVCYNYTPYVLSRLGRQGELVLNRLMAFLVFCVGLQIGVDGIRRLVTNG